MDLKLNKQIRKVLPELSMSASDASLEAKRQIRVVAASGKSDRSGDIVQVDGIELKSYQTNPVVLYGHDHFGLPIAKAVSMGLNAKKQLEMVFEFADAATYAFADTVYRLIKGGFLKGVSIGARVIEAEWITDTVGEIVGRKYTALELLEVSVVTIPADSRALITAVKSGVVTEKEFEEYMEKTLDSDSGNTVSIDTEGRNTTNVENDAMEKAGLEKLTQLETRITSLEDVITQHATQATEGQKLLESLQSSIAPMIEKVMGKQAGPMDMTALLAMASKMLERVK